MDNPIDMIPLIAAIIGITMEISRNQSFDKSIRTAVVDPFM